MSTQTQTFLQGAVVDGKYELRQYLGGSDRGPIFLTEFGSLRRQNAAIKLVRVRPGNAELQLSRWRLAANLSHPHLIRIFDTGRCEIESSPMLYVVTEQADETLGQIIPERALTPEEAREMLVPVLEVLTYMHSKGIVHGRIKPSNIMAVGEQLKLSSDSLCHLAESPETFAHPSTYDPPEGARGGVFPAGDIWSLGVTLVEVLTQKLPVSNPADRKEPALPENLPEPFVDIIRHCLRREPKSRWTAPDIVAHLPRTPVTEAPPSIRIEVEPPDAAPAKNERIEPAEAAQVSVERKEPGTTRKYAIGATVAGLLLITIFGMMGLVHREPAAQNAAKETTLQPTITTPTTPRPAAEGPKAESAKRTGTTHQGESFSTSASATPPEPTPKAVIPPVSSPAPAPTHAVDLSTPTDSARGGVTHESLPEVPRSASATISGTVRVNVRVNVDSSGKVTTAELNAAGPSRYFANLSLQAARDWKFTPPNVNGAPAVSTWILHFGYTNAGAKAVASQTAP